MTFCTGCDRVFSPAGGLFLQVSDYTRKKTRHLGRWFCGKRCLRRWAKEEYAS